MSKIFITGHSRGIGNALATLMEQDDHTVVGASRSNGYDITDPDVVELLIEQHADCDVFVNNAYVGTGAQTRLFRGFYDNWRLLENKTIVNINSRARLGPPMGRPYCVLKRELHKEWTKILDNDGDRQCRIINISPGWVDTDMIRHRASQNMIIEQDIMSAQTCASLIKWSLDQPQHIEIGELSLWHTTMG